MKILVLSGGGSRGAFQVGVLQALTLKRQSWDMIVGVSVGALNGSFLAQYSKKEQIVGARDLLGFWLDVKSNKSIYKRWFPFGRLHGLWKGGIYDSSPINKLVRDSIDLNKIQGSGVKLRVGSVNLENGQYFYAVGSDPKLHDWILASSAFPIAFSPIKISNNHWVDGGVRDIIPIADVISEPNIEQIDVILSGPQGDYADQIDSKDTKNVVKVALRTMEILANETFSSDLDKVPEELRSKIKIYEPDINFKLPFALDFDPNEIRKMIYHGIDIGYKT